MLLPFGHRIIHLPSVDSTNNYTANLLREGKIGHGAVILADEQLVGRGQRGASWTSKAGENLLVTFLATPDNLSVSNQEVITQFITVSIADFLGNIGISGSIKWPNDIYVGGKKLAGILIENALNGGNIAIELQCAAVDGGFILQGHAEQIRNLISALQGTGGGIVDTRKPATNIIGIINGLQVVVA